MRITNRADLSVLSQTPLFSSLSFEQISEATESIDCCVQEHRKGEIVMRSGDPTDTSSLVMSGSANIMTAPNIDGSQKIIAQIGVGEMYGEPFNCLSYTAEPITVVAVTGLKVLKIDVRSIFAARCSEPVARRMLANLAVQFAEKIIVFRNKIEVLSQPTVEMKILTTVKQYAEYQNTVEPVIPFSQGAWADYLCVNRGSIARGMKHLEQKKLIEVDGRRYRLLKTDHVMFIQRSAVSPQNSVHAKVAEGEGLAKGS